MADMEDRFRQIAAAVERLVGEGETLLLSKHEGQVAVTAYEALDWQRPHQLEELLHWLKEGAGGPPPWPGAGGLARRDLETLRDAYWTLPGRRAQLSLVALFYNALMPEGEAVLLDLLKLPYDPEDEALFVKSRAVVLCQLEGAVRNYPYYLDHPALLEETARLYLAGYRPALSLFRDDPMGSDPGEDRRSRIAAAVQGLIFEGEVFQVAHTGGTGVQASPYSINSPRGFRLAAPRQYGGLRIYADRVSRITPLVIPLLVMFGPIVGVILNPLAGWGVNFAALQHGWIYWSWLITAFFGVFWLEERRSDQSYRKYRERIHAIVRAGPLAPSGIIAILNKGEPVFYRLIARLQKDCGGGRGRGGERDRE